MVNVVLAKVLPPVQVLSTPPVLVKVVVPLVALKLLVASVEILVAVKLLVRLKVEPVIDMVVLVGTVKLPLKVQLSTVNVGAEKLPLAVEPLCTMLRSESTPVAYPVVSSAKPEAMVVLPLLAPK